MISVQSRTPQLFYSRCPAAPWSSQLIVIIPCRALGTKGLCNISYDFARILFEQHCANIGRRSRAVEQIPIQRISKAGRVKSLRVKPGADSRACLGFTSLRANIYVKTCHLHIPDPCMPKLLVFRCIFRYRSDKVLTGPNTDGANL